MYCLDCNSRCLINSSGSALSLFHASFFECVSCSLSCACAKRFCPSSTGRSNRFLPITLSSTGAGAASPTRPLYMNSNRSCVGFVTCPEAMASARSSACLRSSSISFRISSVRRFSASACCCRFQTSSCTAKPAVCHDFLCKNAASGRQNVDGQRATRRRFRASRRRATRREGRMNASDEDAPNPPPMVPLRELRALETRRLARDARAILRRGGSGPVCCLAFARDTRRRLSTRERPPRTRVGCDL